MFLDYNLVTVARAVVVAEPASMALPSMKPGDVINGEFTLTNYGLIRADNLKLTLPQDDPYYRCETLGTLPESLAAKERLAVPYRVTCIKSPEGDGTGTGGGCSSYTTCATVDYGYKCTNGADTRGTARHCWTYTYGSCGGSPPVVVPGGGGSWDVGGGVDGGTSSPAAPAPRPITGFKCFPAPVRKEAYCESCALAKETRQGIMQDVASQVNLVLGEYTREHAYLTVKVPGGTIAAERRYYANAWHFEHTRHNLVLKPALIGGGIESIDKAGVPYTASALDSDLFLHDTYRIRKTASGFRWEDESGGFKKIDPEGRLFSVTDAAKRGVQIGMNAFLFSPTGKSGPSRCCLVCDTDELPPQGSLIRAVFESVEKTVGGRNVAQRLV